MNLDEIREIVDFMKSVGLCELTYSEKHTTISLKLTDTSTVPSQDKEADAPAPDTADDEELLDAAASGEFDPSTIINTAEVRQAATEAATMTANEVKKAALRAALVVNNALKDGAEYIKSKREERQATSEDKAEEQADDAESVDSVEQPTEIPAEQAERISGTNAEDAQTVEQSAEPQTEAVKLDTESAKTAVLKTAETLYNTAKAGASFGKAGLKRGKGILSSLLRSKYDPEPDDTVEAESIEETDTQQED